MPRTFRPTSTMGERYLQFVEDGDDADGQVIASSGSNGRHPNMKQLCYGVGVRSLSTYFPAFHLLSMLSIRVPLHARVISYDTHYSRIPCQGYALTGKTPRQIAKMVEEDRDVSHCVGGNVVAVCYDPSEKRAATLFEMWPSDIPDQAMDEWKWLKEEGSAVEAECLILPL